jgi:carbon-monoxide dehydrogenase large subunit
MRVKSSRVAASPMETRAVLAAPDPGSDGVTVWSSTQVPYLVRAAVAQHLGLREEDVRVIAPDVGGGFGAKVHVYPEEILLAFLARLLRRPVRWVEDRQEHFVTTAHGRDQDHGIDVAFDEDGRILAVRDHFVQDCGVGFPFPMSSAWNVVSHLQGLLRIPAMEVDGTCVLTNKVVNVPYRGSGRPESTFTRDRMLHRIAREVGIDFTDALRRNMLTVADMPYRTGAVYRDGEEIVYDGCDMGAALEKLEALVREHPAVPVAGERLRRGVGIGTYTEGTGVGPFEGAVVSVDESGRLVVEAGGASQGQSHETTLAQVVADEFGVDPAEVLVRNGDTGMLRYGIGTFASRTTIVAGSAVLEAARKLRRRVLEVSSEMLEIHADDLTVEGGRVSARDAPSRAVSLRDVFMATFPGPRRVAAGSDAPGLKAESYFVPPTVTWSYGVVAAAVAVDVETGFVTVEKFWIVHDCGRIINPLVVEGQVDGALVQGLGAALFEQVAYDRSGTPLTTTFMDYLLPTSVESPEVAQDHVEILSERNPLGVKGIGESGIIAAPSAVVNAVEAALGELVVDPSRLDTIPLHPESVLGCIRREPTLGEPVAAPSPPPRRT